MRLVLLQTDQAFTGSSWEYRAADDFMKLDGWRWDRAKSHNIGDNVADVLQLEATSLAFSLRLRESDWFKVNQLAL